LHQLLRTCDGKINWKEEKFPEKCSSKGEAFLELMESFGNESFVVFSQYLDPLLAIAKIIKNSGRTVGFFTGLNTDTREQHKKEFIEGKRSALCMTIAGIRGINLNTSRFLVQIGRLYSPTAEHQLRSRIRRLSSNFKSVNIYTITTKNTVEENIISLLGNRSELAKFINDNTCEFNNLTDDQVEKLIGKRESLINMDSLDNSEESFKNDLGIE
jgi:SNF2 family DNA or RNA helicase